MLSSFMGPYLLYYILILCIYPVKTYAGEFFCYVMVFFRSVYVYFSNFYIDFIHVKSGQNQDKILSKFLPKSTLSELYLNTTRIARHRQTS